MLRRESLRKVVREEAAGLGDLVRTLHEETLHYQEESRKRYEAVQEESRKKYAVLQEETREFNRELLLRNEKVVNKAIAEIEDGRKQIRANTEAVLALLDRFARPGDAPA